MNEEWSCPRCENLNTGDICEVCKLEKKEADAIRKQRSAASTDGQKEASGDINANKIQQETGKEKAAQPQLKTTIKKEEKIQPEATTKKAVQPQPEKGKNENYRMAEEKTVSTTPPKKKWPKVMGGLAAAAVLVVVFMNSIKENDYESKWDVFVNQFRSEDSQVEHYLNKGREALDDGNADEAEFFFENKVLDLDSDNEEAIVGCIRANTWQKDDETVSKYLKKLGKTGGTIEEGQEFYVDSAVEKVCEKNQHEMVAAIRKGEVTMEDVDAFFEAYQQYDKLFSIQTLENTVVEKYLTVYDTMDVSNISDEMKTYFLTKALTYFPENEKLSGRLETLTKQIEEEKKRREEEKKRKEHLAAAYEVFNSKDYNQMKKFIDDSPYTDTAYYYVDGAYKESVESGHGLILDGNGIYVGDIANNKRNGSGVQFYYYKDYKENYRVMDGVWVDNVLNGQASVTWFANNGTKAVTSGNFIDGFYDGNMTIKWDGWTGSFTADNGKITSGEMVGSEYRYAYVSNSTASAWWYTTEPDERYGFGLRYE